MNESGHSMRLLLLVLYMSARGPRALAAKVVKNHHFIDGKRSDILQNARKAPNSFGRSILFRTFASVFILHILT